MKYRITNNWYEEAYLISMTMGLLFEYEFPKWFGESVWFKIASFPFSVASLVFAVMCFGVIFFGDKYFKDNK
jgi:hypothetical protein